MKAQYIAKINNDKRHDLRDVVPLEKPYSLMIDICDVCNMKCKFCFHSDAEAIKTSGVQFGVMSEELFKSIIDSIATWEGDRIRKLKLFANGEPLLNKSALDMIRYAKRIGVSDIIEMTTNGSVISDEIADNIADAGLDILNISINGITEKQYQDVCGYNMKFDHLIDQIKRLYEHRGKCRIQIKYSDIGYSDVEKDGFVRMFGDICDQIYVESISASLWPDTNIQDKVSDRGLNFWGEEFKEKKVCTSIFTQMVINSKGQAKLCCSDWGSKVVLGDVCKQSVKEIWQKGYIPMQKRFLLEGRCLSMCKDCNLPDVTSPDNLDEYVEEVIKRY